MSVAGQDATEAFQNVDHSEDAQEILKRLFVGNLKRAVSSRPGIPQTHSCPALKKKPNKTSLVQFF